MRIRSISSLAGVGLIAAGLTACGTPPPPAPTAVAIVLGAHANQLQFGSSALAEVLDEALRENATVAIVTDEGTPQLVAKATIGELPNNPGTRAREMREIRASVAAAIDGTYAATPESDPLEAIAVAAASVRGLADTTRVVVTSSMLATTGALDMTEGLLNADPADVLEVVEPALPDLTGGVVVELVGIGQTRLPQEPLTEMGRKRLISLWTVILEAAGATVQIPSTPVGTEPPAELPPVTPVPVTPPAPFVAPCYASLSDSSVGGFRPDEAEFNDPAAARQVVADVAAQLAGCAGTNVSVVGTTSSYGSAAGRQQISTARAQLVASLLAAELGRDASSFAVRGAGYDVGAGCIVDRAADGTLVEELAAQNRRVIITIS